MNEIPILGGRNQQFFHEGRVDRPCIDRRNHPICSKRRGFSQFQTPSQRFQIHSCQEENEETEKARQNYMCLKYRDISWSC